MARTNYKGVFKKILVDFIGEEDPILAMLEQTAQRMMEIESEAIECLDAGLEDSLQFYEFPEIDKRKVSSTNVVERIIREVRWRSRVIGVFPNQESYIRLITCYLIEYSEDWINERSYIKQDSLIITMEASETLLAAQTAS